MPDPYPATQELSPQCRPIYAMPPACATPTASPTAQATVATAIVAPVMPTAQAVAAPVAPAAQAFAAPVMPAAEARIVQPAQVTRKDL